MYVRAYFMWKPGSMTGLGRRGFYGIIPDFRVEMDGMKASLSLQGTLFSVAFLELMGFARYKPII